jgi:hypothetical protein
MPVQITIARLTREFMTKVPRNHRVPAEVIARIELERQGIVFMDSGSMALIMNRDPQPVPPCKIYNDPETGETVLEQIREVSA